MNELSLFSGAGGGLLGTKLLGWKAIGYVESNDYCQRVIQARIKDGILNEAPIFGDIRAFIREGYAEAYQGAVDVLTGGFPCQPFSVAGNQLAKQDGRNMWPETAEVIRIIRPKVVFLENVPGLLSSAYALEIFGFFFENGYEALPPLDFGAYDVGSDHKRRRVWIIAYSNSNRFQRINPTSSSKALPKRDRSDIARVAFEIQQGQRDCIPESWIIRKGATMAHRVDRTKAIGNGQVPAVVKAAWETLNAF